LLQHLSLFFLFYSLSSPIPSLRQKKRKQGKNGRTIRKKIKNKMKKMVPKKIEEKSQAERGQKNWLRKKRGKIKSRKRPSP